MNPRIPQNRWSVLDGLTADEPPGVSVIVPYYEQPGELARTLAALAAQTYPAESLEVIVVDDGSTEPPRVPEGVRLLRQDDRGFRLSAARNLGARAAVHPLLCFLDADTAPEPGYVAALTRLPALAAEVVAVGRRRHADFTGVDPLAPLPAADARLLDDPRWLSDGYRDSRDLLDADDRSYRYVIGAVLACSRAFFEHVGGFDESFTAYGGEDWEWAYRAWLGGAAFAHVPAAVAWHDGPDPGRRGITVERKNLETLRLAELIPVPGSGGVRGGFPDLVVRPPSVGSSALDFLAREAVLADLPHAAVDGDPARARYEIVVEAPCRVRPGALAAALRAVEEERLGRLTAATTDGAPLLSIRSLRAAARARFAGDSGFPEADRVVPGIEAVVGEPDLEAYLGGWG